MKTINISEFRANLLKYLEIANSGELISVTSNGKMLATVCSPINRQQTAREQLQLQEQIQRPYGTIPASQR